MSAPVLPGTQAGRDAQCGASFGASLHTSPGSARWLPLAGPAALLAMSELFEAL